MTESEFIKEKQAILKSMPDTICFARGEAECILEELGQYRAIGTVKYFRECANILKESETDNLSKIIDEWLLYQKIGTVEEIEHYVRLGEKLNLCDLVRENARLVKEIQLLSVYEKRLKEYEKTGTVKECREAREILFRGKHIHALGSEHLDGTWVYGYLCNKNHIYSPESEGEFLIGPETACQYTGLTDKTGRKIFEGDIVNCNEKRGAAFWHCRVVWNDVLARFDVIAMDCPFPMCLDECIGGISINGSDYEVIGNIFDNPELLEEG